MGFWVDFISCYKETRAGKEMPLCRPIACSSGSVRCPRWPAAQALPELHTFLCRGVPLAPKVPQDPVFHPTVVASCLHTCSSCEPTLVPTGLSYTPPAIPTFPTGLKPLLSHLT